MFQQIRSLTAGVLCALALAVTSAAPAAAHDLVHGRAGQIRSITHQGDPVVAQQIAAEFVGLIHTVHMEHPANTLHWILRSRDGAQAILTARADLDDPDAILAIGRITRGALKGATVSTRGYRQDDLYLVDTHVSFGTAEVAFTQALERVEETDG